MGKTWTDFVSCIGTGFSKCSRDSLNGNIEARFVTAHVVTLDQFRLKLSRKTELNSQRYVKHHVASVAILCRSAFYRCGCRPDWCLRKCQVNAANVTAPFSTKLDATRLSWAPVNGRDRLAPKRLLNFVKLYALISLLIQIKEDELDESKEAEEESESEVSTIVGAF